MIFADNRRSDGHNVHDFVPLRIALAAESAEGESVPLKASITSTSIRIFLAQVVGAFIISSSSIGLLAAPDESCVLPQDTMLQPIRIVNYGLAYHRDTALQAVASGETDVFLVCGGSHIASLQPLCIIPFEGPLKVAVYANEYNNLMGPAYYGLCGDYVWRGSGTINQQHWYGIPVKPSRWVSELYLIGNGGDDTIAGMQGSTTRNFIFGDYAARQPGFAGPGFDMLKGGSGDDQIFGEDLDDRIYGYGGNDFLVGGGTSACAGHIVFDDDVIYGGEGDDIILGDDFMGDDCAAPSQFYCGSGKDPTEATTAEEWNVWKDDRLTGGGGADILVGGPGEDVLSGEDCAPPEPPNSPKDILCGGPGRDWFYADAPDVVYYEAEGDVLTRMTEEGDVICNNCFLYPDFRAEPELIECAWNDLCPNGWREAIISITHL